jgi:hypothetical protein
VYGCLRPAPATGGILPVPAQEHITRLKLPHWHVPGALHFITYRLANTIHPRLGATLTR